MKDSLDITQDVLFQKIASKWYVFTEIDGNILYSPLPSNMHPKNSSLELYHVVSKIVDKHKKTS